MNSGELTIIMLLLALIFLSTSSKFVHDESDEKPSFKLLRKKQGENWRVWNPADGIIRSPGARHECDWTFYRIPQNPKMRIRMCVHKRDDISSIIKRDGRWFNCEQNTNVWRQKYGVSLFIKSENITTAPKFFVDVGANIGACVMEMLLASNAHIVAFEPSPRNLFCLTSTLLTMPDDLRSRVTLLPIGLGDRQSTQQIFGADGNLGNSVVGGQVRDKGRPSQIFLPPEQIQIEAMGDILNADHDIDLMKIDAQGFECKILQGIGPSLAGKINTILTEVAPRWLRHQKCSPAEFFNIAQNANFQVTLRNGKVLKEPLSPEPNDYEVELITTIGTKQPLETSISQSHLRPQTSNKHDHLSSYMKNFHLDRSYESMRKARMRHHRRSGVDKNVQKRRSGEIEGIEQGVPGNQNKIQVKRNRRRQRRHRRMQDNQIIEKDDKSRIMYKL